jgi:hypothetical protein
MRTAVLLKLFHSKFAEDCTFLLAITLAAGFYSYERALPFAEFISLGLSASVLVSWIWIALASGFMRRGVFVVFSLVYWLLPQFIILRFETTPIRNYSAVLHTFSRFSEILVRAPLDGVSEIINMNTFLTGVLLLFLCEIMFLTGFIYRDGCKKRHWYRIFRERYDI